MAMAARSPRSSVLSPQGELSQNLSSSAFGDTPCPKKMRRDTEVDSETSVIMSPFLAMRSSEGKVISISSSSSSDEKVSGDEGRRRVRVNLGNLLGSGRIVWPEEGVMANIQVDVTEEPTVEDGDQVEVQEVEMNE